MTTVLSKQEQAAERARQADAMIREVCPSCLLHDYMGVGCGLARRFREGQFWPPEWYMTRVAKGDRLTHACRCESYYRVRTPVA